MESTAGDTSHCRYNSGGCRLHDDTALTWSPDPRESCEFIPYKNVSGKFWQGHWLAESAQILLTFNSKTRVRVCKYGELLGSDQGVFIKDITPTTGGTEAMANGTISQRKFSTKRERSRRRRASFETPDFIAAELQKLEYSLSEYVHLAFKTAAYNLCKHTETAYGLLLALTGTNPTLAARILLKQKYVRAQMMGPFLEILPCKPVEAYSFEPSACRSQVLITIKHHNELKRGILDPTTNIVTFRSSLKPYTGSLCHKGLTPLCINTTCHYYHAPTGRLLPAPIPKKRARAMATNYLELPEMNSSIYHALGVFNYSVLTQHVSINDLFKAGETHDIATHVDSEGFQTVSINLNSYGIQSNIRGKLISLIPGFSVNWIEWWQTLITIMVAIDMIRRLALYIGKKFNRWRIKKRPLVIAATHTKEEGENAHGASYASLFQAQPSAPPMISETSHSCGTGEPDSPPPSYQDRRPRRMAVKRQRPAPHQATPPKFDKWPMELSEESLPTVAACGLNDNSVLVVKVNGKPTRALIDTGSYICLLGYDQAKELRLTMRPPQMSARSVGGQNLPILGVAEISLEIAGQRKQQEVYIMKSPPFPLIIGVDCMKKLGQVTIDYQNEAATINGVAAPLGETLKIQGYVTVANNIQIPPRSEARVMGRISSTVTGQILIDPQEELAEKTPVLVARVIARPQNQEVPLRVLNPTKEPQTLYKDMTIASVQEFEELPPRPCQPLPKEDTTAFLNMFEWPTDLEETELFRLQALMIEYHEVFAKSDADLGCLTECPHRIELLDKPPTPARPYRIPRAQEATLKEQLDKLLEANIIRPSSSPFASPIVLVKKRDGSLRLCVDYRRLNKVSQNLIFPLPQIQDTLDRLGKAKFYSVLDLNQGFFQIQIHEDDIDKTAFTTPLGNFEFLRLPMGLKSSPATFQRAMSTVFSDILHSQLLVYLDDLVIHSCDFDQHLDRLRNVFARLQFYNLKVKPRKCKFARRRTEYLGHVISENGIEPDKGNIEKVVNYPVPKTVKQVRAFIGITSYYRRFIRDFAKIAAPLHGLMRKDTRFRWGAEHQKAFETLKNALVTYPILAYPDFDKPFVLSTDASDEAIGAVLSQPYENGDRPVAYGSRVLNPAEKKYACVERELLAIVHFLKAFRPYLWGRKFTIYTDHKPLQYLINHKDPSSRLMRWNLMMQYLISKS